jgi:hypothetical protein
MYKSILYLAVLLASNQAAAQSPEDALVDRFKGRSGAFSEDLRVDEHDLATFVGAGPKTGCHGDTISAGVTISSVSVSIVGDVANVDATYTGKYTRQGWMKPCVQTPGSSGHEDKNLSGVAHFSIKQKPWGNAEFTWKGATNQGEVKDPNHRSNTAGVGAVQNAIASGM